MLSPVRPMASFVREGVEASMGAGKIIAGLAAVAVAAEGVVSITANATSELLRPPGIQSEHDFMARCIKCGKCVEACPYAALHVADATQGAAAGSPAKKAAAICSAPGMSEAYSGRREILSSIIISSPLRYSSASPRASSRLQLKMRTFLKG